MGCLGLVVVVLLALAVPASIAPASLVGAYVVVALLAIGAGAAVVARSRQRPGNRPITAQLVVVVVSAAGYAAVVTAIHAAA